jgi:hypothetical protein
VAQLTKNPVIVSNVKIVKHLFLIVLPPFQSHPASTSYQARARACAEAGNTMLAAAINYPRN